MASSQRERIRIFSAGLRWYTALAVGSALAVFLSLAVQAQTFTVIHNFVGTDGSRPASGMAMDRAGNFYGTTWYGGDLSCGLGGIPGCGVIFKLKNTGSGWVLTPVYKYLASQQNYLTDYPGEVAIGPNGTLYGPNLLGGSGQSGSIFNARPGPIAPYTVLFSWSYDAIYQFTGGYDGGTPNRSAVIFDQAGNLYDTTYYGGSAGWGTVFELTPSGSGWKETVLYSFGGGSDGAAPHSVTFDDAGNLYGDTAWGGYQGCNGNGCGTIYKLTPSGSGWTHTVLHAFQEDTEGGDPGTLIRDSAGNLYGMTGVGAAANGGTVWELSPSNGGWTFNILYTFPTVTTSDGGPFRLTMDAAGNLYGSTNGGGAYGSGSVFRLTPSNGGWIFTDLHDFEGLSDGCLPRGPVTLDANGDLFGTAEQCGKYGGGLIWEVTP